MSGGATDGRSLTVKSLDVLAAFDATHQRLSLSQISRRSALPLTTVHRIVTEMERWGALERHDDATYGVGLRVFEIAAHAPRAVPLREAALGHMEDLYEATHENIQLAVLQGREVVYLERLSGRQSVAVHTKIGGRFATHVSAAGLVLLAHAPTTVQDDVLSGPLTACTPFTITDPRVLRSQLAAIRRDGYAISDRQVTTDAIAVAAPIRDAANAVVAALSIVAHADHTTPHSLLPALRMACQSISRSLNAQQSTRTLP